MAQGRSDGIQKLMQAEQKAAQIVAEARKERTERLKSARNEAMKEIDTFRAQKQSELDEMQQKMAAVNTSHSELQLETQQKIEDLQQRFKENVAESIQILLQKVGEVDISVPNTYKQRGASA